MSGAAKSSRKSGKTPQQENQPAWWDSEEQPEWPGEKPKTPRTSRISLRAFGKKGGKNKRRGGTPRTEESKGPVLEKQQQRAISDAEGPEVGNGETSVAARPSEDAPNAATSAPVADAVEETHESGSPRSLVGEISLEEQVDDEKSPASSAPDPAMTTILEGEPREGVARAMGQEEEGDELEAAKDTSDVTPLADVDNDQGQIIDKGDVTVEALPDEVSTVASSLLSETAPGATTTTKDVDVCSFCQVMHTLFHRPQQNVEWVQDDRQ